MMLTIKIPAADHTGMRYASSTSIDVERLEHARLGLLLAIGELAEAAGVSRKTVWTARRGEAIGVGSVRKLAQALCMDPRELVRVPDGAGGIVASEGTKQRALAVGEG